MSRIHPEYLNPEISDRSVAADVLVREAPDEEENEEDDDNEEDEGLFGVSTTRLCMSLRELGDTVRRYIPMGQIQRTIWSVGLSLMT